MVITERTDCTLVVQKESSNDAGQRSFVEYSEAFGKEVKIFNRKETGNIFTVKTAKESLFSDNFIILYFDKVPEEYQVGTKVGIIIGKIMWLV